MIKAMHWTVESFRTRLGRIGLKRRRGRWSTGSEGMAQTSQGHPR
jgi:hypothetical protein